MIPAPDGVAGEPGLALILHPARGAGPLASTAPGGAVLVAAALLLGLGLLVAFRTRARRRRPPGAPVDTRRRAEQAEGLADELQVQATDLQEKTAELELLNEELSASEARLRGIIDSSLDAIVTINSDSVITEWSHHAEQLFGWTAAGAIGKTLLDTIIPPRYHQAHLRGLNHYLATGEGPILNQRIEIVARRRDGREFPVELTVAPARWGSNVIFSAFIRDISQRVMADRRLAAEHAVTRVLAESHTLEAAAPRILAAIGDALGWGVGGFWVVDPEANQLRCIEFWHAPELEVDEFEHVTRRSVFTPGIGLPGRVWARREALWILDVTDDLNFPRAQIAAASQLHAGLGFPVQSGEEVLGVIEFFNQALLEPDPALLDMVEAIGSDIGQSIRRVRAEEERDRLLAEMERVNEELQRANAELAARTLEAERARALADEASRAKSDFLANMSHELRTPINAIVGYTDLLALGIPGPVTDEQQAQLSRIRVSSRHLLELVEDILDLSKIEAGRMGVEQERARVVDAVTAALSLILPQADSRGIEIDNRCEDEDLTYLGDEGRVRQILTNLLSNAIKFTEPGGRVTVSCCESAEPPEDAHLSGRRSWIGIRVEDTGIGIAPEEIEAVFQPFVQADRGRTRRHGGTGLGLTISRQLAHLMGGELTLKSEVGRGSCFTLWLPATRAEGSAAPAEPVEGVSPAGLGELGRTLQQRLDEILAAVFDRLRTDPMVPSAHPLSRADLEDHQSTFLTDVAQALVALGDRNGDGESRPLQDGSEIQRLIAERHGAQRARLGFGESELRRELEILREEIVSAARAGLPAGDAVERQSVLAVLTGFLGQAEQVSLRGYRAAAGGRIPGGETG